MTLLLTPRYGYSEQVYGGYVESRYIIEEEETKKEPIEFLSNLSLLDKSSLTKAFGKDAMQKIKLILLTMMLDDED